MIDFSLKLVLAAADTPIVPAALVVSSLNMLIQILFDICYGSKGMPKIRGYRGE